MIDYVANPELAHAVARNRRHPKFLVLVLNVARAEGAENVGSVAKERLSPDADTEKREYGLLSSIRVHPYSR